LEITVDKRGKKMWSPVAKAKFQPVTEFIFVNHIDDVDDVDDVEALEQLHGDWFRLIFFSLQNTFFNQLQQSANPKKKKSKYIFSAFFLCKNNQSYKSYKRNSVFKKTKIDLIS